MLKVKIRSTDKGSGTRPVQCYSRLGEATAETLPSPHVQLYKYRRPQAELFKK